MTYSSLFNCCVCVNVYVVVCVCVCAWLRVCVFVYLFVCRVCVCIVIVSFLNNSNARHDAQCIYFIIHVDGDIRGTYSK